MRVILLLFICLSFFAFQEKEIEVKSETCIETICILKTQSENNKRQNIKSDYSQKTIRVATSHKLPLTAFIKTESVPLYIRFLKLLN